MQQAIIYRTQAPSRSDSKHSKVISNWYVSVKAAGLFWTFTPSNETTDIVKVVGQLELRVVE